MNAKKAKALRKLLRNMVKSHPQGAELAPHEYTTMERTEKSIYVPKENGEATDPNDGLAATVMQLDLAVEKRVIFEGQKVNSAKSQRGVYLHLKKEMAKV